MAYSWAAPFMLAAESAAGVALAMDLIRENRGSRMDSRAL
jgi:hypothetical protein